MTRTAADVQAEIDALKEISHRNHAASMERVNAARANTDDVLAIITANIDRINEEARAVQMLEAERDHLARIELDAVTPPDVRVMALRLRAAHRSVDGWAMGAEDPWEALDTSEAAAWAAVAREAGRG